jgi:putative ABC transport system permease protein
VSGILQDVVFGWRALLRRPGITLLAVLMLTLGIGANTAIFSVVQKVILEPLPYPDPAALYFIGSDRGGELSSFSAPEFLELRKRSRLFEAIATWNETGLNLVGEAEPERVSGVRITANLLPLLGVEPILGRGFTSAEEVEGDDTVVLVSAGFWKRRYASSAEVLGSPVKLNGRAMTIVGVLPPGFAFPEPRVELFVPLAFTRNELDNPAAHYLRAIGRLARGASLESAREELDDITERATESFGQGHRGSHGAAEAVMQPFLVKDHRVALMVLTGAVAFVLLIVCANVANLLLARGAERAQELAVRTAMGAGRGRLVRQLLTESLLLAGLGGVGGLLVSFWIVELVVALSPSDLPRIDAVAVDAHAFLFVAGISLAAGIVFGCVPALQATRGGVERALREASRSELSSRRQESSRNVLVTLEVAVALVLLVGAGLTLRSFWALGEVDPGFRASELLTARLHLAVSSYSDGAQQVAFARRAREELRSIPGVKGVGLVAPLPYSGSRHTLAIEIPERRAIDAEPLIALWHAVTPGYFSTMGIRLLAGRDFTERELGLETPPDGGPSVLVVNQAFARRYFPGEDPIGKRVRIGYNEYLCEIVGVVENVRGLRLDEEERDGIYTLYSVTPLDDVALTLRSARPKRELVPEVRSAIARIDPEQPVYAFEEMPALVEASVAGQRFLVTILASFAAVAVLLAALGIYAVISYAVQRRRREIGIRVALGAGRADVLELVLSKSGRLFLAGSAIGLAAALVLSRYLSSELYGIKPTDVTTYVAVAAGLAVVSLVAAAVPGYRVSRLDPLEALRQD